MDTRTRTEKVQEMNRKKSAHIGSMKFGKLSQFVGVALVKDRIQAHYAQVAVQKQVVLDFKRKHGYCGGTIGCMENTGAEQHSCDACLEANANPRYKKRVTDYGRMRAKEKDEQKKARRKRAAEKKAVGTKQRKAA